MLDSRYRLDSKLGEGGMGVVYRGMNVTIERPVAIKLLRPEYASTDGVAERFLREARAAVKIRGAHVVEILDFGKAEDGAAFFVMELLEGVSLADVMRREKRLPVRRAVDIAAQICVGLHVAHREGIVHRDLKPANVVLITHADRVDFVKILDFGVAKILGEAEADLTRTGMLLGTVDYMAPEQIQGLPVDARTDIYALGVLMYRVLTSTKPFKGEGIPAMIYHHINSEPESLRARAPDANIPEALDDVVRRCMAKEPSRRFVDMAQVREALLQAAEGIFFAPPDDYEEDDLSLQVSVASDWVSDIDTFERHREAILEAASPGPANATRAVMAPLPLPPPSGAPLGAPPLGAASVAPVDSSTSSSGVSVLTAETVLRGKPARRGGILIGAVAGAALVIAAVFVLPALVGPRGAEGEAMIAAQGEEEPEGTETSALDQGASEDVAEPEPPPVEAVEEPVAVPGSIIVRADAPNARVFVDGVAAGRAPATFAPSSFEPVSVRVVAGGRVPFETRVRPTSEELVVQARLRRIQRSEPARETKTGGPPVTKESSSGDDFFPMDL